VGDDNGADDTQGTATTSGSRRGRRPRDTRRLVATVLAVLLSGSLFIGVFTYWADQAVFDEANFANRMTKMLESEAVRSEIAAQFTDALIQNGPSQLAGFRGIIRPAVDDLMTTEAFKQAFRNALRQAHRSLFTEDGNDLVVNLSQSLGVLAGSLQITNPDVASNIPTGLDQFLVDLGNDIRGMELWQTAEEFQQLAVSLLSASLILGVVVIWIDREVRRGVFKVGVALAAAGFLLVGVAVLAPRVASVTVSDDALRDALVSGITIFVGDLQVLGVWMIGYGVVAAALATASTPRRQAFDIRVAWYIARDRYLAWQPETTGGRVGRAAAIIATGIVLVLERDAAVPLAVALLGAYITYVGVVQLLEVVGRTPAERVRLRGDVDPEHPRAEHRLRWIVATGVALFLILSVGGVVATSAARREAAAAGERACNGHAELCDRTIDRVAFPGSHNSMSTSSEPGWLFAEQSVGIRAQLEHGIRALLVKTHYGVPSGITFTGADLVVTDRAAELAVNPKAVEQALPAGAQSGSAEEATKLAASARLDPSKRDIYLCHVYCEYGATRFRDVLHDIKRFLDRNPDEVIILFIGDYVSPGDTQRVFEEAGLLDRLYDYDPAKPPPTLGQMIDARQNIFLLSEFTGHPPAWNNPGYGLFQDTPYTFPDPADLLVEGAAGYTGPTTYDTGLVNDTVVSPDTALPTGTTLAFGHDWTGTPSCEPNRGTPDSPLFQINHWVTPAGAASTVAQAREVNAYDVLMPRVRSCMAERGRFPTIVGVNFATVGDLLRVVDDLNQVG